MNTTHSAIRAILAAHDAETLADLQRNAYKYTEAGVAVSFRLDDDSYIWPGDEAAEYPPMVSQVAAVGVSCIIERSDAEVPAQWLTLAGVTQEEAVEGYDLLVSCVQDRADELWDEIHGDEEDEENDE